MCEKLSMLAFRRGTEWFLCPYRSVTLIGPFGSFEDAKREASRREQPRRDSARVISR